MKTVELTTPLWTAAIPQEWEDFEAKFPGDAEFSNWAGRKIGAISGTFLRASDVAVVSLFSGLIKHNMAKEVNQETEIPSEQYRREF